MFKVQQILFSLFLLLLFTTACQNNVEEELIDNKITSRDSLSNAVIRDQVVRNDSSIIIAEPDSIEYIFSKSKILYKAAVYDKAIVLFNKSGNAYLARAIESGDPKDYEVYVYCLNMIGMSNVHLTNHSEAEAVLNTALKVGREYLGSEAGEVAMSLHFLGNLNVYKRNFYNARNYYERSLKIKEKLYGDDSPEVASIYGNLAVIHDKYRDYETTLSYYRKILPIFEAANSYINVAIVYENIGAIYNKVDSTKVALKHLIKAKDIRKKHLGTDHPIYGQTLANIGLAHHMSYEYDKALKLFFEVERIYIKKYGLRSLARSALLLSIGQTYLRLENTPRALEYYHRSLIMREELLGEDHPDLAPTYIKFARLYTMKKKHLKALEAYQKSLILLSPSFKDDNFWVNPDLSQMDNQRFFLEILHEKSELLRELGKVGKNSRKAYEKALQTYQLVLKLLERMRASYVVEASKFNLSTIAQDICQDAIDLSCEIGEIYDDTSAFKRAFEFSEKSKAALLSQSIATTHAERYSNIPDSLLEKTRAIQAEMSFYESQKQKALRDKKDSTIIRGYKQARFDLELELHRIIKTFEQDYPSYYRLKYQVETTTVCQLQSQLDDKSIVLEYFVGRKATYLFLIQNKSFKVDKIELPDSVLKKQVMNFSSSIISENDSVFRSVGDSLYSKLIPKVLRESKDLNVTLIPDGVLTKLSFGALPTSRKEKINKIDTIEYRYLVQDHGIKYSYSATLMLNLKDVEEKPPLKNFLAYAPIFTGNKGTSRTGERLFRNSKSDKLGVYLPYSEDEVRTIESLFRDQYSLSRQILHRFVGSPNDVYLGYKAKEKNIKQQSLDQYKYIHFATHGLFDYKYPQLSGLLFYSDDDSTEDGVLRLAEIYNLNLNAELVTLSACETGLGHIAKGEGLIGLTRGFLFAGAKNVLVSLWSVEDRSTAVLMRHFYKNMVDGKSKRIALREAKLELIKTHTRYKLPRHWAPFILIGDHN